MAALEPLNEALFLKFVVHNAPRFFRSTLVQLMGQHYLHGEVRRFSTTSVLCKVVTPTYNSARLHEFILSIRAIAEVLSLNQSIPASIPYTVFEQLQTITDPGIISMLRKPIQVTTLRMLLLCPILDDVKD